MNFKLSTLPNGVRVATAEMPQMRSASVGLWAFVGGRHEPARWSGISHFIEHLLFKGTGKRSARQITSEVEGIGGYLNAFTTEDHTCYYAKAGAAHLPRLIDVLADMFLDSRFDPEEIEREREVIREEIFMYRDQPAQHVQELLSAALWSGHALARPLTGTEKTVSAMGRDHFLQFMQRHYNARTTVVTVAGNVAHAQVLELLAPNLGRLRPGRAAAFGRCTARALRPGIRVAGQDSEQAQLAFGFPAMGRKDPRRFALKVLSVLLGENMSSRLFQSLRERHGLCYSVQTCTMCLDEVGAFHFSAGLDPGNLPKAIRLTLKEFRRARERAPSRAELQRAKEYTIGQIELSLESTSNQVMWLGESLLAYGRVMDPDEVEKAFAAVTPEEVCAVAATTLNPKRLAAALVGKNADANLLARLLKQ